MTTLQTLRLPRGLWADLEETIIMQDRQFLSEVARSLGLPVADVLKKCLGTGNPQAVAVLLGASTEDDGCCPWWMRSAGGMWAPCTRLRLTPSTPCQLHQHTKVGPTACLGSDARLTTLPTLQPIRYKNEIYWVSDDPDAYIYREDGSIESSVEFKFIDHRDQRICVAFATKVET